MPILNDIKNCVNCIYFNEGPEDSYGKRDYFCDKEQSFIEDIYVDITKSSPLYNNEKPKDVLLKGNQMDICFPKKQRNI